MPGNYVRPPSVAASWTPAEWRAYRETCLRLKADERWWKNVGRACVHMADVHMLYEAGRERARLRAERVQALRSS